jgi:uncharacterized membrane protein YeaQ/YmgE (transglycosylase-associated protein family)
MRRFDTPYPDRRPSDEGEIALNLILIVRTTVEFGSPKIYRALTLRAPMRIFRAMTKALKTGKKGRQNRPVPVEEFPIVRRQTARRVRANSSRHWSSESFRLFLVGSVEYRTYFRLFFCQTPTFQGATMTRAFIGAAIGMVIGLLFLAGWGAYDGYHNGLPSANLQPGLQAAATEAFTVPVFLFWLGMLPGGLIGGIAGFVSSLMQPRRKPSATVTNGTRF